MNIIVTCSCEGCNENVVVDMKDYEEGKKYECKKCHINWDD